MAEKENELLDNDIDQRINDIRYKKSESEKTKKPLFYFVVVALVTISVLFSLLYRLF